MVASYPSVVPYMSLDQIVVGERGGVAGGICNVVYYPSSMSKERVLMNYKLFKNKNPPIL